MHPLLNLAIVFLLCLVFIAVVVWIIDWKFDSFLKSLGHVIKLEFSDPIGRISLAGTIILTALFIIAHMFDVAMWFASNSLQSQPLPHSLNPTIAFIGIAIVLVGDLIVLGLLKGRGQLGRQPQKDNPKDTEDAIGNSKL